MYAHSLNSVNQTTIFLVLSYRRVFQFQDMEDVHEAQGQKSHTMSLELIFVSVHNIFIFLAIKTYCLQVDW